MKQIQNRYERNIRRVGESQYETCCHNCQQLFAAPFTLQSPHLATFSLEMLMFLFFSSSCFRTNDSTRNNFE